MVALKHRLLLTVAVLLIASPVDAQGRWKKYSNPTDGFEVEFPGEVQPTPTQLDPETQKKVVRAMQYMLDGGDFVYAVAYSLNRQGVNFEEGAKSSFAALRCKTTTSDTPLNIAGVRGRELRGTDCHDGTMRAESRYFTTANWFYQVITLFKKQGGNEAEARRFLRSFKLTAR